MTFKEFLEFISQNNEHFLGFIVVCCIFCGLVATFFNGIVAVINAIKGKKTKKVED